MGKIERKKEKEKKERRKKGGGGGGEEERKKERRKKERKKKGFSQKPCHILSKKSLTTVTGLHSAAKLSKQVFRCARCESIFSLTCGKRSAVFPITALIHAYSVFEDLSQKGKNTVNPKKEISVSDPKSQSPKVDDARPQKGHLNPPKKDEYDNPEKGNMVSELKISVPKRTMSGPKRK